ncbi:MAG: hypothetical protein R3B47_19690 [Bacteroidia bacterium]
MGVAVMKHVVGKRLCLAPQARALHHAKFVLLIHHGQAKALKNDLVFNQCVRTHHNAGLTGAIFSALHAVLWPFVHLPLQCRF